MSIFTVDKLRQAPRGLSFAPEVQWSLQVIKMTRVYFQGIHTSESPHLPLISGKSFGEEWSIFRTVRPLAHSLNLFRKLSPGWHKCHLQGKICVRLEMPRTHFTLVLAKQAACHCVLVFWLQCFSGVPGVAQLFALKTLSCHQRTTGMGPLGWASSLLNLLPFWWWENPIVSVHFWKFYNQSHCSFQFWEVW